MIAPVLAYQTKNAIDRAIIADKSARFKILQGQIFPQLVDAFRPDDGVRSHLGASVIGTECERALFYGWRWVTDDADKHYGKAREDQTGGFSRMLRLWNRGHIEEGRFIALLLMIGVEVYTVNAEGRQYGFTNFGGHFAGSGDSIVRGLPEYPTEYIGGEFKTHGDDSFKKLATEGVRLSKWQHFVQMQVLMRGLGLRRYIYGAVNKNTEELYWEFIEYDEHIATQYTIRGGKTIFASELPRRINNASPALWTCKFCDHVKVCYGTIQPKRSCRTCQNIRFLDLGHTICALTGEIRNKEAQVIGCDNYTIGQPFKNV